jgi:bifunctional ADP-heptose synthase (sugar kinase/adenylyltransferase)
LYNNFYKLNFKLKYMKDISKILQEFKKLKLAVVGDIMLDRTSWGVTSDRKNPEEKKGEDIPIIQIQKEELEKRVGKDKF